jgi:hypothetical protein
MIDLDEALTRSAPPTLDNPERDAAVADLVSRTRPKSRGRRWAVRLGVGAMSLGVLAGGAAAASTAIDWVPWLQEPDLEFEFVTPGGLECFGRAAVDEERDWPEDDVDALAAVIRDPEVFDTARDRVDVYLVPDPAKDPDELYVYALAEAYSFAVRAELSARGADEIDWGFQIQCPAAEW